MNLGELNTKIDFYIKVASSKPVEELEPLIEPIILNIWAKKIRLMGSESIKLGMEHNTVPVNFIVRVRSDITEEMYIKHDNTIYNIVGYEKLKDNKNYMLISTVRKQRTI